MSVPISSGGFNRLLNFRPSFKAATFERERAQDFPPWLNEIEICGILRLEGELPPLILQAKQEDVAGPMRNQVIDNRIDLINVCRQPRIDFLQEVRPVDGRARWISFCQSFSGGRAECAEDVSLTL